MRRLFRALRGTAGDLAVLGAFLVAVARPLLWRGASPHAVALSPRDVALGTLVEGVTRRVTFVVTNPSDGEATVHLRSSCSCTSVDRGPIVVPARGARRCGVDVRTDRRPGFNLAHVQLEDARGVVLDQASIAFTTVQPLVFDPPVVAIPGGGRPASVRVFALGAAVPPELEAVADDPSIRVALTRTSARTWDLVATLAGIPAGPTTTVRVRSPRRGGGEDAQGIVTASLPPSVAGSFRLSPVAEPAGGASAGAWMLVESGHGVPVRVVSVIGAGDGVAVDRVEPVAMGAWLWLTYPCSLVGTEAILDVAVGGDFERVVATLPRLVP